MKKICIVSTVGFVLDSFMLKHIESLRTIGEVTVVIGNNDSIKNDVKQEYIKIGRKINLMQDIKSLFELYKFFKVNDFDLVLSLMPKSGLLAMVASCFLKVDTRIHFFTGQVWATKKGFFRGLLKYMDKITVNCSTHIFVDSKSQKEFLLNENVLHKSKGFVLHEGSISGVDINKFQFNTDIRKELRKEYNFLDGEIVFTFLGRITKDKGILDLIDTFKKLFSKYSNIKLLILGPIEDIDLKSKLHDFAKNENVVLELEYCKNPENILNVTDVLVLPSYREGFGTVVIEAASMGIPTIGSNIYGLTDAIIDNQTGLLHNVADVEDMFNKYSTIIDNRLKMKELGKNAYIRVHKDFRDDFISKKFLDFIEDKLIETR